MRPVPIHKSGAFTLIELIAMVGAIVVVVVLVAVSVSALKRSKARAIRSCCVNNLELIGTAYGVWANDHNGRFPASESVTNGGWWEVLNNADQGFLCWTNYAIMANELGSSPLVVTCPSDERRPTTTFSKPFANTSLSFFVGVSANQSQSQSLLAGDRNLGDGVQPGDDYGFSPESGIGNDVAMPTNSKAGPVCWSLKMHSAGNTAGTGNILLADGSVQVVSTLSFRTKCQPAAGQSTNWPVNHVPSSASIRVLFP